MLVLYQSLRSRRKLAATTRVVTADTRLVLRPPRLLGSFLQAVTR